MKREGLKKVTLGLVAVGLSLTLLVTGAMPSHATPAEKEVRVGIRAIFTGPLASVGVPWSHGQLDCIRYINEERGGIGGINIHPMWEDTKGLVPGTITAHKRFKAAGVVLETEASSTPTETLAPMMQRDEMPLLWDASITRLMVTEPLQWTFGLSPQIELWIPYYMKWVLDNWTEPRPPRLGYIFYEFASGYMVLEGCEFADEMGFEFVGYEVTSFTPIDTTTEWLRLAAKEPDFIFMSCYGMAAVCFVKDAARLGIQEKGITLCCGPNTLSEDILRIVGRDGEGWYITSALPSNVETEAPGVKLAMHYGNKYRGLEEVTQWYLTGWLQALVGGESIRLAIQQVGYENLTRRAIRDGLASIKDFDTGLVPPSYMSDEKPWFSDVIKIHQVQEGKMLPVTDWMPPPGVTYPIR